MIDKQHGQFLLDQRRKIGWVSRKVPAGWVDLCDECKRVEVKEQKRLEEIVAALEEFVFTPAWEYRPFVTPDIKKHFREAIRSLAAAQDLLEFDSPLEGRRGAEV